jgi:hypothetical protein
VSPVSWKAADAARTASPTSAARKASPTSALKQTSPCPLRLRERWSTIASYYVLYYYVAYSQICLNSFTTDKRDRTQRIDYEWARTHFPFYKLLL